MSRPRRFGGLVGRPPDLAVRVGFNGLAQLAPVLVALAITPLLLDRLGLDRFGIWSLALVILSTLTLLEGGVAASLARFFAMYAARGDRAEAGRLLVSSFLFFAVLGLAMTFAVFPLAPHIVAVLDVPAELRGDAVFMLRWVPPLAALALMGDSTAALLQGNGQFRALAATMVTSAATFAVAVVVLVQPGALDGLVIATALRYGVVIAASFVFAAPHVSIGRPALLSRATTAELWRYASRMQLSVLTGLVNVQLDGLVIAAALPIRYVGLYSIGMQAASAARSLPLYAFAPLLTRLTTTFRNEGRDATAAEFERLERTWLPAVLGYGVVAVAAIGFSVPVWLGGGYVLSGVTATVLLAGYIVHVALTGMRTCYVRAVGRPGLETRYSTVWMIGNAVLTVPAALVAGLVGVVAVTAATGAIASLYFVALCRRTEGLPVVVPTGRWCAFGLAAAAITVAGELAIVYAGLHGFAALALTALPALAGLVVFAAGRRQTPAVRLA